MNEKKDFEDWWIVKSATGKRCDELGIPAGETLCRSYAEAKKVAQDLESPILTKYQ